MHQGRTVLTRRRWIGGKILLVALGALVCTGISLGRSPEIGRKTEQLARARAAGIQTQLGVATLGVAYLNATSSSTPAPAAIDGGIGNSGSAPMRLNKALDPLWSGGALYPLRHAIQQLSIWLIIPLILLSLGTAALKGVGSDVEFARVGKRLVVVVVLLWAYPVWDVVIFRGLAIPITAALENQATSGLANAMAGKLGISGVGNPTGDLSQIGQKSLACQPGAPSGSCPNVSTAGDVAAKGIEAGNSNSTDDNGVAGNTTSWIGSTVTGGILTLFHLALSGVLWFIWLGVVVGRCLSLTFAPMAIVWGLHERKSGHGTKWFHGHAKMCLAGPMFAMTTLVMMTILEAVFAPATSGHASVLGADFAGVALKAALFLVLGGMMLKGKGMSNIIAGDVAEMAEDVGRGVRDKGIAAVATVAKGTMAGGAYMSLKGENTIRGKMSQIGGLARSGDRRGALKAVGGGILDAGRGSLSAAKWTMKNRVQEPHVRGSALLDRKNVSSMTVGAYQGMKKQLLQDMKPIALGAAGAAAVGVVAERVGGRSNEATAAAAKGITLETHRRPGEAITINMDDIYAGAGKGFDRSSRKNIAEIGAMLFEAAKAHDAEFGTNLDPSTNMPVLDEQTQAMLAAEMDNNPEMKRKIGSVLQKSWGDNMPKLAGVNGAIPDVARGMTKSTILAHAVAFAAMANDRYQEELHNKEKVSALSGSGLDSASEVTLRSMDSSLLAVPEDLEGDVDKVMVARSLKTRAEANARQAWYRSASVEERARAGMTITGDGEAGEEAARDSLGLHDAGIAVLDRDTLHREGSFASMPGEFKKALRDVSVEQAGVFSALNSRKIEGGGLGFDADAWKASGVERYNGRVGSIYSDIREKLKGQMSERELYQAAAKLVSNEWKSGDGDVLKRPVRAANESDDAYSSRVAVELNNRIFSADAADVRGQIEEMVRAAEDEVYRKSSEAERREV